MIMRIAFILLLFAIHSSGELPLFSNRYYNFYHHQSENSIAITSSGGDELITSSSFYQLFREPGSGDTLLIQPTGGTCQRQTSGARTELIWQDSNEFCITVFTAIIDSSNEEVTIRSESKFLKRTEVLRQALVLNLAQPLNEVYRRNTRLDDRDFQDEYWLNKEGLRFGEFEKTVLVYHTPEISSLQLDAQANRLIVNLDYNKDHPFQYFPQRDSMMHEKINMSASIFNQGDIRKNFFSIHAGKQITIVPRLMLNPDGYLSAYVFTEHADWTDLSTHRAVYFGSEEITEAENATGGFVKNKIPITKSVFYANPDHVLNSQSRHGSIFKTPIASIKGTKGYLNFLQQLQNAGTEICLHTPEHFSSTRMMMDEACTFMKKNFNTVTWIDHGYNNGPKNNREAFVCDGLNSSSPFYAKDIWEKYGIRYFWNSYYEDFATADSLFFDFNGSPMHPYPGFGDASPLPLYWKNQTRTGDFYSWPTRDLLEMPDPASWNYHFSAERLNDFVQQRSVKFQHCYPAGSIPGKGFWKSDDESKIVIEPEFEKMLNRLASFRDNGLINLTTVRDLLDYWIAREKIRFEYLHPGTVKITNENIMEVKGLSFAVAAIKIFTEKNIQQKFDGGDLIFWFDMKPGESVELRFSN